MQRLHRCWKYAKTGLFWGAVSTLLLVALLLVVLRFASPRLDQYLTEAQHRQYLAAVQHRIGSLIKQPVAIGGIQLKWHNWSPELHVFDVRLLETRKADGAQSAWLSFENAVMRIALLESLRQRNIIASSLSIAGLSLRAERDADGAFSLRDRHAVAAETNGSVVNSALLLGWLSRQTRVELRDIALSLYDWRWHDAIDISDLSLVLVNTNHRHRVQAALRVGANDASSTAGGIVRIVADLNGTATRPDWAGEIFISAEQLPPQALLKPFAAVAVPLADGAALSFRTWSKWHDGTLKQALGNATLQLTAPAQSPAVPTIIANTDFRLRRTPHTWQLHCEALALQIAQRQWPQNRLLATIGLDDNGNISVDGSLRHLHLAGLMESVRHWLPAATLALPHSTTAATVAHEQASAETPLQRSLAAFDARDGQLEQVQFQLRTAGDDQAFRLRADVKNLHLVSGATQLQGANGTLEIGPRVSLFAFDAAVVEAASLSTDAERLLLEDLQGTLVAINGSDGLHLSLPQLAFRYGTVHGHTQASLKWPPANALQRSIPSPYLDASVWLRNVRYPDVQGLMPTATWPLLREWLVSTLPAVVADSAFLRLRGRLSDPMKTWIEGLKIDIEGHCAYFPYDFGDTTHWPPIEKIEGTMTLRGSRLLITAKTARFVDVGLRELLFQIDDITAPEPLLHVSYDVKDDASLVHKSIQAMQFTRQTIGAVLDDFRLGGRIGLRMKLAVPLAGARDLFVSGRIRLQRNRLQLPAHQQGLTALSGAIDFEHDGKTFTRLTSDNMSALYLAQPLSLEINLSPHHEAGVRITTALAIDHDYLRRHSANTDWLPLSDTLQRASDYMQGSSRLQLVLDVYQDAIAKSMQARLSLDSDLHGLTLNLPTPFGKTAQQRRRTRFAGELSTDGTIQLQIDYADRVRGAFALALDKDRLRDISGYLHLGAAAPPLATAPPSTGEGVAIRGRLERVAWREWYDLLQSLGTSSTAAVAGAADTAAPALRSLSLGIGELHLGNLRFNNTQINIHPYRSPHPPSAAPLVPAWAIDLRGDDLSASVRLTEDATATQLEGDVRYIKILHSTFSNTHIHASRQQQSGGWRIRFAGEKLSGTVAIPPNLNQESVEIDLTHLALSTADDAVAGATEGTSATTTRATAILAEDSLSPEDIPAFSASVRSLRLDARDLGTLQLDTQRRSRKRHDYTFAIDNDAFSLTASGVWKADRGIGLSTLRGRLTVRDTGTLLARFDYDHRHLKGGSAQALFDLHWRGSPIDYGVTKFNGDVSFEVNDGRLLQVKRGLAARAFGLLTITTLPQRLLLNFNDVFERGLPYSTISGAFLLKNGNACIHYLGLSSDIAYFNYTGHIGLNSKTHQGTVTVKPRITNALPLIPIRFLEFVMGAELLDPLFSYRYAVSGGWDDEPRIKALSKGPELPTAPQC